MPDILCDLIENNLHYDIHKYDDGYELKFIN
jgi:hypothetical protein